MNAVTIDVRTKIILLFFTNILLLLHISDGYECLLMIGLGLLFFLEGDRKRALYYVISFLALIIIRRLFIIARVCDVLYCFVSSWWT